MLSLLIYISGFPGSSLFFFKVALVLNLYSYYTFFTILFLLTTVVSCFYYLRVIKIIFYEMEENLFVDRVLHEKLNELLVITILETIL